MTERQTDAPKSVDDMFLQCWTIKHKVPVSIKLCELLDHPRSGVADNFGRVCLSVYLFVRR